VPATSNVFISVPHVRLWLFSCINCTSLSLPGQEGDILQHLYLTHIHAPTVDENIGRCYIYQRGEEMPSLERSGEGPGKGVAMIAILRCNRECGRKIAAILAAKSEPIRVIARTDGPSQAAGREECHGITQGDIGNSELSGKAL